MFSILTVSQFLSQINDAVAGEFVVEGEVAQYKISQNKWVFFDLKDETAVLNCFSTSFMLRQPLEDGLRIRVKGYPKIREQTGRFNFTVQSVELVGAGTIERAYQLLKQKLIAEGLFDAARKRAIPRFPATIGVIASRDSAAWGDFKRILNNRWGGVAVQLRHVTVQGESAVGEIAAAFQEFNETNELYDVIVLIRGGGSLEDLAAFNTEAVVRAMYTSRIPVVSGVGHERDETLADLVADVRASTPSHAAELVAPDRREIMAELDFFAEAIGNSLGQRVRLEKRDVLGTLQALERLLKHSFDARAAFIRTAENLLKNVDPSRLLKRGYSIVRTLSGRLVTAANQVDAGDTLVVELAKGSLATTVLKKRVS